jgi:hypothetical protein
MITLADDVRQAHDTNADRQQRGHEQLMEKEIAAILGIGSKTIAVYLNRACGKTGCTDRRQLRGLVFEFAASAWEEHVR